MLQIHRELRNAFSIQNQHNIPCAHSTKQRGLTAECGPSGNEHYIRQAKPSECLVKQAETIGFSPSSQTVDKSSLPCQMVLLDMISASIMPRKVTMSAPPRA